MGNIAEKEYYTSVLESFHRNLTAVFKEKCAVSGNSGVREAVSVLERIDADMTGVYRLGNADTTDRAYLDFIRLLKEYGIPYVETRVNTDGTPNECAYIIYDIRDQYMLEELRLKALKQACNYRITMETGEAEDRIAGSENIKDKDVMTIRGLNYYEKEVLLKSCGDISGGFLICEEETRDEEGTVRYDMTVRDSKVLTDDSTGRDICRAYLHTMVSLYGYNGNKIIDHLNADLEAEELIELNVEKGNTVYVAGANEGRIKHYIEINPYGFAAFVSTVRDGKRCDAYMQPESRFRCKRNDPEYEANLLSALKRIPSKTVLTGAKELSSHLKSHKRIIGSGQPVVGRDEYIAATRENEIVDIIDEAIRDKFFASFPEEDMTGQDKFDFYKEESKVILEACLNETIPDGYDPSVVLSINAMLDEAGIDKSNYENVPEAMDMHDSYTHEAETREHDLGEVTEER